MQKLQTQNELLEAKYFQVEELEERLENGWRTCYCEVRVYDHQQGRYVSDYRESDCPCPPVYYPPGDGGNIE